LIILGLWILSHAAVAAFWDKKEDKKKEEEKTVEKKKTDIKRISEIPGVGPSIVKKMKKAKIESLEELYDMDIDGILSIEGIGKKTAEVIIKNLKKIIAEENNHIAQLREFIGSEAEPATGNL